MDAPTLLVRLVLAGIGISIVSRLIAKQIKSRKPTDPQERKIWQGERLQLFGAAVGMGSGMMYALTLGPPGNIVGMVCIAGVVVGGAMMVVGVLLRKVL
jgi:hypothetical protein